MSMFDSLTLEEKLEHFRTVAKRALPLWGLPMDADLKLLNFTENATYLVRYGQGQRLIMRVHRLPYVTMDSIRTELAWINALRKETDVSLASPIPMKDGGLVATIHTEALQEDRHVVCFTFVEGKAPKDSSDGNGDVGALISRVNKIPDRITIPAFKEAAVLADFIGGMNRRSKMTGADRAVYRQVGTIMAKIHLQSLHWRKPAYYQRISWGYDATFGKKNNFYDTSYRDADCLNGEDFRMLDLCRETIHDRLALYGERPDRYGMIHSDMRTANLLKEGGRITVLDFDDCGMGWYMYDVAGAVALMEHRSDLGEIVDEILKGYESIRPLSEEDKDEIPTFIMMRRVGMLEGLIYRIGSVMGGSGEAAELTPEILAFYAKGTVELARKYVEEMGEKPIISIATTMRRRAVHQLEPYAI